MAIYAVGDVQGCYAELQQLLEQVRFDPAQDKLWLVGDLVNRGPSSLEVLRLVKSLGNSAITVLGNHDLHLLAVAEGVAELHRTDTLNEILAAPDRGELLLWLRNQRLLHAQDGYVLVHAGLLPQWSVAQAGSLAREVEAALRADDYAAFLVRMYGNAPHNWDDRPPRPHARRRPRVPAPSPARWPATPPQTGAAALPAHKPRRVIVTPSPRMRLGRVRPS